METDRIWRHEISIWLWFGSVFLFNLFFLASPTVSAFFLHSFLYFLLSFSLGSWRSPPPPPPRWARQCEACGYCDGVRLSTRTILLDISVMSHYGSD